MYSSFNNEKRDWILWYILPFFSSRMITKNGKRIFCRSIYIYRCVWCVWCVLPIKFSNRSLFVLQLCDFIEQISHKILLQSSQFSYFRFYHFQLKIYDFIRWDFSSSFVSTLMSLVIEFPPANLMKFKFSTCFYWMRSWKKMERINE